MDITQARTFLAVVETGSFLAAAEKVHVTQSTVSMRIKSLEEQIGKPLFTRSKSGATLTSAGEKFLKHAESLLRIWGRARLELRLPDEFTSTFSIGGQYSLWDDYLIRWVPWIREQAPGIALRTRLGRSAELVNELMEGSIDLAVVYQPETRGRFGAEHLFDERLVLVSSESRPDAELGGRYVMVNWGPEFLSDHAFAFPDKELPAIFFDLGSLAISYLLEISGSGYFPLRVAQSYVDRNDLVIVEEAPVFSYPVYAVYHTENDDEMISTALKGLRELAPGHG